MAQGKLKQWNDRPLEAAAMRVLYCEGCGGILFGLEAEDGNIFAQGHVKAGELQEMLVMLHDHLPQLRN
jgi:hypothetical protein